MKDMVFALSRACFIGSLHEAATVAAGYLSPLADEMCFDPLGGVRAVIVGRDERRVMYEAHIDEIGMVVTAVLEGGYLRAAAVGGVDIRALPSARVTVHGSRELTGVFTSTPPHLAAGDNKSFPKIDEVFIDVGCKSAQDIVAVGDFITFDIQPQSLLSDFVTGKSLDNRAGVAALIRAAQLIRQRGVPEHTIILSLCAAEELGHRGAVTEAYTMQADEAIAVDVSFGMSPLAAPEQCGTLGAGSMLGVSPVLYRELTERLKELAMDNSIPIQMEIMGGRTGTDADAISLTRSGVPTALLSIPLRYMHTPIETVKLSDVEATAQLLCEYAFAKEDCNA